MKVPKELQRTLPQFEQQFADGRQMLVIGIFMFNALAYTSSANPIGVRNVSAPVLGAIIAAAFLTIRPYNPFKSLWADMEGKSPEAVKDDEVAQRLLRMLRSNAARIVVWRVSLLVASAIFVGLVLVWSLILPLPESAMIEFATFILMSVLWALFCGGMLCCVLFRWMISNWNTFENQGRANAGA